MIIMNEHMFLILSKSYKVLLFAIKRKLYSYWYMLVLDLRDIYILQQLSQMSYRELLRHFHPPFVD